MDDSLITPQEKDGLAEICNIGASKTSSYLTEKTGDKFQMEVPEANIIRPQDFINFYSDITDNFDNPLTVVSSLEGTEGSIIISSSEENIRYLLSTKKKGDDFKKDVKEEFNEAVNKYIQGMNNFLGLQINIGEFKTTYKYAGPVIYQKVKEFIRNNQDTNLFVTVTSLYIGDEKILDLLMVLSLNEIEKVTDPLNEMI